MSQAVQDGRHQCRMVVPEEWIDENDHMNDARYVTVFSNAGGELLALFDVYSPGPDGLSTVTAEMHLRYIREAKLGEPLLVSTQLLDFDEKRVHYFQELTHAEEGYLMATAESMILHVDITIPKVVPFPERAQQGLQAMLAEHRKLPVPEGVGRQMGIPRKTTV